MPRHYKRKRLAEEWAQDIKPKKFGNYFNRVERQRAKDICRKELEEYSSEDISEMRFEIEQQLAWDCYQRESEAARESKPYNCSCPDIYSWSDEKVLEYLGLI